MRDVPWRVLLRRRVYQDVLRVPARQLLPRRNRHFTADLSERHLWRERGPQIIGRVHNVSIGRILRVARSHADERCVLRRLLLPRGLAERQGWERHNRQERLPGRRVLRRGCRLTGVVPRRHVQSADWHHVSQQLHVVHGRLLLRDSWARRCDWTVQRRILLPPRSRIQHAFDGTISSGRRVARRRHLRLGRVLS